MRKSLSRTTENFCEPPDSFLMRDVREVVLVEDVRQAIWAGVSLREGILFRGPKVTPPRHKGQGNENRDGSCDNDCCQKLSSQAHEFVNDWSATVPVACLESRL